MCSISVQLFKVLTVNLDFAFGLARCGKIIGELHSQPRLRRAAEGLRQPYSHLRANAGLTVHDVVESLPRYPEHLCSGGYREPQRLKTIMTDDETGMSGVFHGHSSIFILPSGNRQVQRRTHHSLQSEK